MERIFRSKLFREAGVVGILEEFRSEKQPPNGRIQDDF